MYSSLVRVVSDRINGLFLQRGGLSFVLLGWGLEFNDVALIIGLLFGATGLVIQIKSSRIQKSRDLKEQELIEANLRVLKAKNPELF